MLNPVLSNRRNLAVYLMVWTVISIAQTLFLLYYFHLRWVLAVADGIVYNLFFLLLGLGIWYIVRYNDFELKRIFNLIAGHAISSIILIGIWLSMAGWVMNIFPAGVSYQQISSRFFPSRIVLGVFYYLVIILIYYLQVYYLNFKEKLKREAAMETRAREAELTTLRAQINPHFLFNSLNSVNSLTITDPDKAREMIVKLSVFLRQTLRNSSRQFSTLDEEISFTSLYFAIEKIRFGDKLNFEVHRPAEAGEALVPNLLLQPLVENAIKYGVQERIARVDIELDVTISDGMLELSLKNQYDHQNGLNTEGVGLKNVRERLELIYNKRGLMEIKSSQGIFTVIIKIPIRK